jgi:HK97 family phage prohead protease
MSADQIYAITGYAVTWDVDERGDIFDRHAFDPQMLAKFTGQGVLLVNHVVGHPLGRIVKSTVDWKGLLVTAEFNDSKIARLFKPLISKSLELKHEIGLSPGFRIVRSRKRADGTSEILEALLDEVSVIVGNMQPVNPRCHVTSSKSGVPPAKPVPAYRPTVEQFDARDVMQYQAKKRHWPPGMEIKDCSATAWVK